MTRVAKVFLFRFAVVAALVLWAVAIVAAARREDSLASVCTTLSVMNLVAAGAVALIKSEA